MKLNCTITQVQCSQKVINIITIIIKTKHHLLTNGVRQRDWWERDADYETLLFVSFIACFVYGPAPVLLFVMKISFCDNESVLNRIKIASDPHNANVPLESSLGPHTMNREISSNHKGDINFHSIAQHNKYRSWSLRIWTPEKVRNSAEDAEWLEMVRVGLFIIKQRFLMKINRAGDTMGVTPDGVLCDPILMISAHRVTLGMNEPLPNISIVWETENGRIKIKTKRWWILERRSPMWKICGKFKNQMYNVHLAWCFNQIWSYQLYKTAAGRFKNSDMILFTLNTSNGDQESSFT